MLPSMGPAKISSTASSFHVASAPAVAADLQGITVCVDEDVMEQRQKQRDDTLVSIEHIQSLCIVNSVSRTLLAPLDRAKFVMQCQRELMRLGTLRGEFRSTWACVRHLAQMEGQYSFWRGNLVQVGSLPVILMAQVFVAFPTRSFIFESCSAHSALGYTAAYYAAMLGGALAAAMVTYPLEFARFRLAVDIKPYKGASYAFKHSLAFVSQPVFSDFPHYLYRGLALYTLGSFVYHAVHNVFLKLVEAYVPPEKEDSGWWPIIIQSTVGVSVSATATLCLHPVDLVRHRMMIAVTSDRLRYASVMDCIARIAQTEGLRGFYSGAAVTLVRMLAATVLVVLGLPY